MLTELLDYELPESSIAQHPPSERDGGRMLVVEESVSHAHVRDLPERVPSGALVVVNDSRVIPARLLGTKATGGRVEVFLLERLQTGQHVQRWAALGRANRSLREGTEVHCGGLVVVVEKRRADGGLVVELRADDVEAAIRREGAVPLPPYVRRAAEPRDRERYQTVYASVDGSVAAPTAGLHLTAAALERMRARGVRVASVTLHVGPGTFRPVSAEDLDGHDMHEEVFHVSEDTVNAIASTKSSGGAVIAIGTTVVRALESAAAGTGELSAGTQRTRLLIQPGFEFRVVDGLLTNFHMPKSTLLALVCAFAGRDRTLDAYAEALARGYRFLSYGDAMWIPRRLT